MIMHTTEVLERVQKNYQANSAIAALILHWSVESLWIDTFKVTLYRVGQKTGDTLF